MNSVYKYVASITLVLAMTGCASTRNPQDPFEQFNRTMFSFNDGLDRVALKPVATVYKNVLPSFVQTGIGNFFGNLADVWTSVNNLLQGKVEAGLNDFMRVAINSTLGFGGVLDIGSEAGLQKHREDFGQTLGVWGIKSGPYVVLPLLGSSTLRDTLATPIDFAADPVTYVHPTRVRNQATVLRLVDLRASVLVASSLVEDAAIDRYEFIRDAYLQRRENSIHDGDSSSKAYKSVLDEETAPKAAAELQPSVTADSTAIGSANKVETSQPVSSDSKVK